jgi:hypothetical protein
MTAVKPGTYRMAVPHPPKPGQPPKAVAVKQGAAGGTFVAAAPKKVDPRQAHLEREVADLKKEMGHMKAMMHEILKKLDGMQKAGK